MLPRLRRAATTVTLLLAWVAPAFAQPPAVALPPAVRDQVDEWFVTADDLLRAEKHSEAAPVLERLRDAAREGGRSMPLAWALCGLGEVHYHQGRYAAGRAAALECLEIYERLAVTAAPADRRFVDSGLGRSNHLLSTIAGLDGNATDAAQRAERAVAAFDAAQDLRGRALSRLQLLAVSNLGVERERALYDRVIADARAASDPVIEARALQSLGDLLHINSSFAEALPKLEAAAALFDAAGRRVELGTVYNSLGRLYRAHGRLDAALAYQLKALAIHERTDAPLMHLQSLNAVAVTYGLRGESRQARVYYERARTLADRIGTPRIQEFVRANLASTMIDDGDDQQAAEILEDVIASGRDTRDVLRMRELAGAYLHLRRYDLAMKWAQRAVDWCGNRETPGCIGILGRRAEVYAATGNDEAALADLRTAMSLIERIRSRLVPADFLKQQFHLAQEGLYSLAIALQVRGGRSAEALATAEHARSRAFVDLLASRDLPADAGPTDGRNATARPADSIGALPLVFRGAPRGGSEADAADPHALLSASAVPAASSADVVAIAARLRSTVLAYWVADDEVFIWVVSRDGRIRSSRVDVRRSRLEELIRLATPLEGDNDGGADRPRAATPMSVRPWRDLYDLLIKPVRDALPRASGARLTIVPHGPLGAVAFAGLEDERGRYLLESYILHYAPSGAVLQFTEARRRPAAREGRVLMVADPVPPVLSGLDRPLPRLPGARAESRAIEALIPRGRLTSYEDADAVERVVRDAASDKAVIHFATHAVIRDDDPFASFLALSPSDDDKGLLTAQEIYRFRLDADFVVLSGCRSAGGRVTGDGVATFARAFIYAGTASVVASLWDVADEPTNRLFADFYRSWLAGASKARALRSAQLRLLHALRAGTVKIDTAAGRMALPAHPALWAGFTLIGEPD